MINVRAETIADYGAVRRINEEAFGQPTEAKLIATLRERAHPHISLVALIDQKVVGHIFFSPVSIQSESSVSTAMGLAPMAVLPEYQRQGVGSALVRAGLLECLRIGFDVVVVVGHPEYYPRFGFVPAGRKGLRCEYEVPDEAFMVAELRPEALAGKQGLVRYHPAFKDV